MTPFNGPRDHRKRVVIVDDSRSIRAWLRHVLESDSRLAVVGEAGDAFEARQVIKALNPDIITLDIEMPQMSGLEFLSRLMRLRPMPVVMVSSATQNGSDAAITALSLGALDCLLKPTGLPDPKTCLDICNRVFSAACARVPGVAPIHSPHSVTQARLTPTTDGPLILLGASTGGVTALETVLSGLDPAGPPVVIVQHMPNQFLTSFTSLLNQKLPQEVGFVQDDQPLRDGQILFAPAIGKHTEVVRRKGQWRCRLRDDLEKALHCPSVDALFSSAAPHGHDVIAALLTGLGRDGAEGMSLLKRSGAHTIGQDEDTCVIYGMPRVAKKIGAVVEELPLHQVSDGIMAAILAHAQQRRRRMDP